MENVVYQLFLVLCRPKELNFTQLIAVTFTTVRPVTRILQQGGGNHKGGTFLNTTWNVCFKYNIECKQTPQKVACDM